MAKEWCVYEHVFPNNKKYIGITSNVEKRWNNGKGYDTQAKMANAIKYYGWDNIQHNVIIDGLSEEQAKKLEIYLIGELETIDNGYNTTIGGDAGKSTYLDSHILRMLTEMRKNGQNYILRFNDGDLDLGALIYSDRFKKTESGFWNEAHRAVTLKHGKFSACDEVERCAYMFHLANYYDLFLSMESGEDVTGWREPLFEERLMGEEFWETRGGEGFCIGP